MLAIRAPMRWNLIAAAATVAIASSLTCRTTLERVAPPVGVCRAEPRFMLPPSPPPSPPTAPSRVSLVTSMGTLDCVLDGERAPKTVASFKRLVMNHFYDGLTFHRVIPNFVIQGGDPNGNGTGGPGYEFDDELSSLRFDRPGVLAMANRGPNTNGSQFFITDAAAPHLDGHDTIFGSCAETDVIHAIASVPRDSFDKPVEPIVIRGIYIR
jgi:peptidyl-prolyl cis-trans isomerase A (cyclophilin A)